MHNRVHPKRVSLSEMKQQLHRSMKKQLLISVLFFTCAVFSQRDSLQIGERYLEDQGYFGITYNQLFDQPTQVSESGFSYGLNVGYMKDIPLVKSGRVALAIGIGYAFDTFNHGLKVSEVNNEIVFETDPNLTSNNLKTHALEIPLEFRWRTSTANKFKFWRIYTGLKLSYNLKNTFAYTTAKESFKYSNINRFQKVQYGITLSAGYAAFNFNLYYGLTPLLKNARLGATEISAKILKMGLVFYIL